MISVTTHTHSSWILILKHDDRDLTAACGVAVAQDLEASKYSIWKVAGLNPWITWQHFKVSLSKTRSPKMLLTLHGSLCHQLNVESVQLRGTHWLRHLRKCWVRENCLVFVWKISHQHVKLMHIFNILWQEDLHLSVTSFRNVWGEKYRIVIWHYVFCLSI